MTYASTRNPERKIELLRQVKNEVIARELSTGEEITLTRNTLNRWWKRVEEPKETEEPKSEATKEVKSLVKALVKKEKGESKLEKTMSSSIDFAAILNSIQTEIVPMGFEIKMYEKAKGSITLMYAGKGALNLYVGRQHCKVNCKSAMVPSHIETKPQKHYFDAKLYVENDKVISVIKELLIPIIS